MSNWTDQDENQGAIGDSFLLKEDGFYLLLEDGGRIVLNEGNPVVTWIDQVKN